jgi:hypothetical protein
MQKSHARLIAVALFVLAPMGANAQPPLKIFDSHLHYNQEPNPFFSLEQVLEVFKRNNVAGILANSRPNRGTHQLVDAKAPGLWVVPFIRPYRVESDVQSWFNEPAIYDLIESEYKRGYFRGVGEFHIHGNQTEGAVAKKAVDFAVRHDLYLLAHSDETAIVNMFAHNPKAKIVWAHTGFSAPVERVSAMLEKYPMLWGELSYRSGIATGGTLTGEWRALFARHSDRFVLGSDTWIDARWSSYGSIMDGYRRWLAQLPDDQARRIAYGNAERLYGGKIE